MGSWYSRRVDRVSSVGAEDRARGDANRDFIDGGRFGISSPLTKSPGLEAISLKYMRLFLRRVLRIRVNCPRLRGTKSWLRYWRVSTWWIEAASAMSRWNSEPAGSGGASMETSASKLWPPEAGQEIFTW